MLFIGRDLIKNCSGLIEEVISLFISKKERKTIMAKNKLFIFFSKTSAKVCGADPRLSYA